MVHGEPDYTVRGKVTSDETHIKGVAFIDPTIAGCKPVSMENPALAYLSALDQFKVAIYVNGTRIDPRNIRALTVADLVKAVGSEDLPIKQEAVTGKLQVRVL